MKGEGEWCSIISRQTSETHLNFVTAGHPPTKNWQCLRKLAFPIHITTILSVFVRFLGWNLFILLIADTCILTTYYTKCWFRSHCFFLQCGETIRLTCSFLREVRQCWCGRWFSIRTLSDVEHFPDVETVWTLSWNCARNNVLEPISVGTSATRVPLSANWKVELSELPLIDLSYPPGN